jgi:acyl carrier protein
MTKKNVEGELKKILQERLDIQAEKIKLDAKLREDLGIDSFGSVEIIFEVKDKFGIEIKDEDSRKMVNFSDIVDYVFNHLKKR